MRYLISNGADPNLTDEEGNPPLVLAARLGDQAMVEWLVEHGADVNLKGRVDISPLHEAASRAGSKEMVEYLLEHGANVNARAHADYTPIHYAIMSERVEVVAVLINSGANVNAKNRHGDPTMRTPLAFAKSIAKERKRADDEIVALLLRHGARLPNEPTECISERKIARINSVTAQDRLARLKEEEARIFVEVVFFWEYGEPELPIDHSQYDTAIVWALKRRHLAPLVLFKDGCALYQDMGFILLDNVKPLLEVTELIASDADRSEIRAALLELPADEDAGARFEQLFEQFEQRMKRIIGK